MTTAMLPPIHHPLEIPQRAVSVIRQVQDAVSALPAPTLPRDVLAATTVAISPSLTSSTPAKTATSSRAKPTGVAALDTAQQRFGE
ncbi:hypothetical protein [Nocardia nova]|uniref:Uncharacterized protein n=1 Tax=Nocardia nova TaxID=37330 RepID=A0A2S5ZVS2_9NOCA|nr:hypothetical protein [Nocardia nova]PPJ19864.1 hypothetical protein C5F51_34305 [Nocardia nova]